MTDLNKIHNRSEFETFLIETINSNSDNLLLGVIYRHPKPKFVYFMKHLRDIQKTFAKENKKIILTSDFNINLLKFDQNIEVNEFPNLLTAK